MTDLDHYLSSLGPVAIMLGGAFEGQTALVAGGVLVRQHLISPAVAIGAGALGSGVLDQLLFVLGRSFRETAIVRRVSSKPAFGKALSLIERFPTGFILSFRFLYGLRAAGPVAVGMSQVPTWLFTVLNAVGAMVWASVFVGLGFAFGPIVLSVLGQLAAHATPVIITLLALGVAGALIFWRWRVVSRQDRAPPPS